MRPRFDGALARFVSRAPVSGGVAGVAVRSSAVVQPSFSVNREVPKKKKDFLLGGRCLVSNPACPYTKNNNIMFWKSSNAFSTGFEQNNRPQRRSPRFRAIPIYQSFFPSFFPTKTSCPGLNRRPANQGKAEVPNAGPARRFPGENGKPGTPQRPAPRSIMP